MCTVLYYLHCTVVISSASKSASEVTADLNVNEEAEKAKELDANSSKDLRALFIHHNNNESNTSTTKPLPTKYHSTRKTSSSKRSSKAHLILTRPLNATVKPSEESVIADVKTPNNGSFLEATLGDIKPRGPEQSLISSSVGDVQPGSTTLMPNIQSDENVSDKVR